jgi:zinc transport system ATP-binding protein
MAMPPSVISCKDLSFAYPGQPIFEGVSFELSPIGIYGLVGPNGGGKTTLLKLLIGLLQPQKGTITVLGEKPRRVWERMGYTPQHVALDPLFPISAEEVVRVGCLSSKRRLWARYTPVDRDAVYESLAKVGLKDCEKKPFAALSGGQRQRVLIARSLVSQPEVLFLDEPTAHIDPSVQVQFIELLEGLSKTMTVVLVSHDHEFLIPIAKQLLYICRGVSFQKPKYFCGERCGS